MDTFIFPVFFTWEERNVYNKDKKEKDNRKGYGSSMNIGSVALFVKNMADPEGNLIELNCGIEDEH